MTNAAYRPSPIDTDHVELPAGLEELVEELAANTHDHWARKRMEEGWSWGPRRDDDAKTHPDLVPYDELSESEKEYDRTTAAETIKAIIALGWEVRPAPTEGGAS